LFKRSGDTVGPLALNLFKNVVGIVLLALTLLAMGEGFGALREYPAVDIYILILSGVLGIAIADTVFFYALNMVGVGTVSIVECSYSPFTILLSWLLLNEQLTTAHYVGGCMILAAVYISSKHDDVVRRPRRQVIGGVLLGVSAMAMIAAGIVFAKPVLEAQQFPLIWAATIRLVFGTLALAALTLASPKRRTYWRAFRPSAVWRDSIPASIMGSYFSMVFWVAGFKYAAASVAAILNQTSVIFALILASIILKEPFTRRKLWSVVLGTLGAIVMLNF
jgi:drug/metabolite transporter (DMT)-like permease